MNYPEQWEGTNRTRLDLKKAGEVVLIEESSNRWVPFKLISHNTKERRVKGTWLMTDITTEIKGGIPTYPINKQWISMYVNELTVEREKLTERIGILKELNNSLI